MANKKLSILYVLQALKDYSDEDNYLTQKEIAEIVLREHDLELERKSIASSLNLLMEEGYDIDKSSKGGYALLEREFNINEITYLIDAIFSSKSISGKQAVSLAKKVTSVLSKRKRKNYNYLLKSEEINRSSSKDVFYNIEIIKEAISKGVKISFQYLCYDNEGNLKPRYEGHQYVVSPYYLVNNYGKYYLISHYKDNYEPLCHFRIEYITDIKILDEESKPLYSLPGCEDFSITSYLNENIYLFSGKIVSAELEIIDPSVITAIKDFFGKKVNIHKDGEKLFASVRCNENSLFYWLLQYGEKLSIVSPIELKERIKKHYLEQLKRY